MGLDFGLGFGGHIPKLLFPWKPFSHLLGLDQLRKQCSAETAYPRKKTVGLKSQQGQQECNSLHPKTTYRIKRAVAPDSGWGAVRSSKSVWLRLKWQRLRGQKRSHRQRDALLEQPQRTQASFEDWLLFSKNQIRSSLSCQVVPGFNETLGKVS